MYIYIYSDSIPYLAEEDGFELKHPCDGEENGGVIWDKRSTGKDLVATGSIKTQKPVPYGISTHRMRIPCDRDLLLFRLRLRLRLRLR